MEAEFSFLLHMYKRKYPLGSIKMLSLEGFVVINNSIKNNDLHAALTICMKVDQNHLRTVRSNLDSSG